MTNASKPLSKGPPRTNPLSKPQTTLPQAQALPLEKRLYRAGQHVVRAGLFLDLWFYFEEKTTRAKIIDTMREYNEFFRFTPHAYLAAYVIHIAAMFDKTRGTISLTRLANEMKAARLIQGEQAKEVDALFVDWPQGRVLHDAPARRCGENGEGARRDLASPAMKQLFGPEKRARRCRQSERW